MADTSTRKRGRADAAPPPPPPPDPQELDSGEPNEAPTEDNGVPDDEEEHTPVRPPVPMPAFLSRPAPRGNPHLSTQAEAFRLHVRADQDDQAVFELIENLGMEKNPFRVELDRTWPERHPETGEYIGLGHLRTWNNTVVTREDVDREWGGGRYDMKVFTATAEDPTKLRLKRREPISISGYPVPPVPKGGRKGSEVVVEKLLDSQRERDDKLREELDVQRRERKEEVQSMIASLSEMMKGGNNSMDSFLKLMELQREEERERRREEREEQERARREERERQDKAEERRLKLEAEEREREREERRAEREREREEREERRRKEEQRLADEREERNRQYERDREDRKRQEEREREDRQRREQELKEQHAQTLSMMERINEVRAGGREGISEVLSTIVQLKEAASLFGNGPPAGDDDKPAWQQAIQTVAREVPGIIASLRPAAPAAAMEPTRTAVAPPVGPLPPGVRAVAVLEDPPAPPRIPKATRQTSPETPEKPPEPKNDLADYQIPPDFSDPEAALTLLVKDVDLAIQRGLSTRSIYDEIVSKFPSLALVMLQSVTAAQIVEMVGQRAPSSWVINSPVGKRVLGELHQLLSSK